MVFLRLVLAAGVSLPLVGSFLGSVHPAGDSLAVFRLPIALAALVLAVIWRGWPRFSWPILVLGIAGMVTVLLPKLGATPLGPVTLYQKNLMFLNRGVERIAGDILKRAPEVITLQEVSEVTRPILGLLREDYPTQVYCGFLGVGGTAVLSHWPAVKGSERCEKGMSIVQLRGPEGPVWVASVHLHWPWPHGQARHRARLLPALRALDGPVVVGGDFNMVPWSDTMRRFRTATRTRLVGPVSATLFPGLVPLPIDHVLAPGGGRLERLERLGSDHHGLLARIRLGTGS